MSDTNSSSCVRRRPVYSWVGEGPSQARVLEWKLSKPGADFLYQPLKARRSQDVENQLNSIPQVGRSVSSKKGSSKSHTEHPERHLTPIANEQRPGKPTLKSTSSMQLHLSSHLVKYEADNLSLFESLTLSDNSSDLSKGHVADEGGQMGGVSKNLVVKASYNSTSKGSVPGIYVCPKDTKSYDQGFSSYDADSGKAAGKRKQGGQGGQGDPSPSNNDDESNDKLRIKKRQRIKTRDLNAEPEFACWFCKRDIIRFGISAKCRDWSHRLIRDVFRHTKERHLPSHIEQSKFNDLESLRHRSSKVDPKELWINAYMLIFDIPVEQRDQVPSPYWTHNEGPDRDQGMSAAESSSATVQRLDLVSLILAYQERFNALTIEHENERNNIAREYRNERRRRIREVEENVQSEQEERETRLANEIHAQRQALSAQFLSQANQVPGANIILPNLAISAPSPSGGRIPDSQSSTQEWGLDQTSLYNGPSFAASSDGTTASQIDEALTPRQSFYASTNTFESHIPPTVQISSTLDDCTAGPSNSGYNEKQCLCGPICAPSCWVANGFFSMP